ncbi:uncharacterized protein UBRO_20551 [Ustilago bromivora]|uniref:Uncharacterized protein n=1 Tax=Ustilago bromivora TaxID=307758 RepID=A0A1K0FZW4_9BASI|nr:uncharacterized protein UBRO_20551 [Ustilago bromivora]
MKPVSARYTLVIEPGDEVNALITSMRNRIAGNVPAVAGSAPLSEQKLVELQPTISEDMDKVAIRILWHRTRAKAVFLQGQHGPRSFLLTHIVYPDFASSLDAYGYVGVWELDPAHGDEKGIMYLRGFFDFSELEFHAIDEHPEFTHRRYWVTARRGSKGYELRLRHMTVQRSKEEIELVQGPSVLRISDFPRDFLSALPDDPVCLMTSNVKQFDPVLSSPVANIVKLACLLSPEWPFERKDEIDPCCFIKDSHDRIEDLSSQSDMMIFDLQLPRLTEESKLQRFLTLPASVVSKRGDERGERTSTISVSIFEHQCFYGVADVNGDLAYFRQKEN